MPDRAIAQSKRPIRWMGLFLVVLAVSGVMAVLFWVDTAEAQSTLFMASGRQPVADGPLGWSGAEHVRCEMVRVWPLPADCQFVFGREAGQRH